MSEIKYFLKKIQAKVKRNLKFALHITIQENQALFNCGGKQTSKDMRFIYSMEIFTITVP